MKVFSNNAIADHHQSYGAAASYYPFYGSQALLVRMICTSVLFIHTDPC